MRKLTHLFALLAGRYGNLRTPSVHAGGTPQNGSTDHLVPLTPDAASRLRDLVIRSGLTLERIASRSGCSVSYLEELMRGSVSSIHPDVLRAVARELHAYPGWIVQGSLDPGAAMGSRILARRRQLGLSQEKLARRTTETDGTGVTPGHIRRIEHGDIRDPRPETLAALASALEVTVNYLLHGSDDPPRHPPVPRIAARPRRFAPPRVVVPGVVGLAVVAFFLVQSADAPAPRRADPATLQVRLTNEGHTIEAFDPLTKRTQWFETFAGTVLRHELLLWNDERVLLVGLDKVTSEAAGAFLVYRMADGSRIVSDFADEEERVERIRLMGQGGNDHTFVWKRYDVAGVARLQADIDNDGSNELIIPFEHEHLLGPSRLRVYGADGTVRGTYYVTGDITFHLAEDFDGDRKAEILLCATSRNPARRGFSVIALDDEHLSGVSRDARDDPRCQLEDGCLAGITFPPFDETYMTALGALRLRSWEIQLLPAGAAGGARFVVWFGGDPDYPAILYLDGALAPVNVTWSDAMGVHLDRASPGLRERFAEELAAWSQNHERFGAARIDTPADVDVHPPESDDAPRS